MHNFSQSFLFRDWTLVQWNTADNCMPGFCSLMLPQDFRYSTVELLLLFWIQKRRFIIKFKHIFWFSSVSKCPPKFSRNFNYVFFQKSYWKNATPIFKEKCIVDRKYSWTLPWEIVSASYFPCVSSSSLMRSISMKIFNWIINKSYVWSIIVRYFFIS